MDWKKEARNRIQNFKSWKPLICIQGGGARGAWEAGVLAALLEAKETSQPVAIWGTSAGSINALWASTSPNAAVARNLLDLWIALSCRIVIATMITVVTLYSVSVCFLVERGASVSIALFLAIFVAFLVALLVYILIALMVRLRPPFGIKRWPGIIPVSLAAKLLPYNRLAARFYTYFCTANVQLNSAPIKWNWDTITCFCMKPNSKTADFVSSSRGGSIDARRAVMCSAALPVLCRPYWIGDQALLDGGLLVNLPAGQIFSQGMLGGNCAICIIPRRLEDLNPQDHSDFRTIKFLSEMQSCQKQARQKVNNFPSNGSAVTTPSHTFAPILVIQPSSNLRSGLICGFFRPQLLRAEFVQGKQQAESLLLLMKNFETNDDCAMRDYLLDDCVIPQADDQPPKAGWWTNWVNSDWG